MSSSSDVGLRVFTALVIWVVCASGAPATAGAAEDIASAAEVFERNLDAIRNRDRDAYLACYLQTDALVRTGPDGFRLGFADHASQSSDSAWPDVFEAQDLRLTPIDDGLVYGTYRYRVSYGGDEHRGISERLFVETDAGWKIALTTAFDTPGSPPPPRALVGGTLIDGNGGPAVRDAVVVMREGRIDCAGPAAGCPVPDGIDTLDVTGMWITPGLIDAHVHFSQTGWADGRPDSLDVREQHPYEKVQADLRANPERYFRSYLCSGVTAVLDAGGYSWTWGLAERTETNTEAPHVTPAGPLLSTLDHWLNLPGDKQLIHIPDQDTSRRVARYVASHGAPLMKVWFINVPDQDFEVLSAAVKVAGIEAKSAGIPLIVHATGLEEAKVALRAGAHLLVHSVWDQPVDDEFIELAKAGGTVYCPTLTVVEGYLRMYESMLSGEPPVVDDPNGCVDDVTLELLATTPEFKTEATTPASVAQRQESTKTLRATMAANLKRVHDAGIPIAMGTDAGNPLTLHGPSVYAEMEAMQAAGLTAEEVLVTATRGAAMAMDRLEDLGTIEQGKIADLVVVEADPIEDITNLRRLRLVVRGGVVRSIDELQPIPPSP